MPLLSRRNALTAIGLGAVATAAFNARPAAARRLPRRASWVAFYGDRAEISQFAGYDVVVLDPHFVGDVAAINAAGATTLGYLSIGELSNRSPFFNQLNDPEALLHENPNWPGSYSIDARRSSWRRLILEQLIPSILAKGFNGLFLDTIDALVQAENIDFEGNQGMRDAGVQLIRAIRRANPDIPIMMNRGYSILPEVVDYIDALLAESLITTYDFQSRTYHFQSDEILQRQMAMLEPARDAPQPVPIYSLDYWNPADPATLNRIYDMERALGHAPYVATILLNELVPEPS